MLSIGSLVLGLQLHHLTRPSLRGCGQISESATKQVRVQPNRFGPYIWRTIDPDGDENKTIALSSVLKWLGDTKSWEARVRLLLVPAQFQCGRVKSNEKSLTVTFPRPFKKKPDVVVSIAGFDLRSSHEGDFGFLVYPKQVTEASWFRFEDAPLWLSVSIRSELVCECRKWH